MVDSSAMPRDGLVMFPNGAVSDASEMPHHPTLDYPFVATADGEFIALRAIVRLIQRDGTWTAVLLDGARHALEPDVARTILDQGPFDSAPMPAALVDPFIEHGPAL